MQSSFSKIIKQKRMEAGLSQEMLARRLFVTKPTVARWESGTRLPDATMIIRIAKCLDTDVAALLNAAAQSDEHPVVIMVDDNKIILNGGLPIIGEVIPNATVIGFTTPSEAVEYARSNPVALAFLDVEIGAKSGLDLCRELLEVSPRTNVVYLTAYSEYSLDAWETGAIGFIVKPLTPESVKNQLKKLRYPFLAGGEEV